MLKDMDFYHLQENMKYNYWIQLLDTQLDPVKTASKNVVRKAGEFIGNKIADAATKLNNDKFVKQEPVE